MKQYLELAKAVKEKGTYKAPAREGMPGTTSLFGYQFRHDLSEGFPLLTTKKLSFKNIVVELLWFLRGDTNIKYLVDNGCNIWNEDAYNFYLKQFGRKLDGSYDIEPMNFEQFIDRIKNPQGESRVDSLNYKLGDCGKQYGALWRNWDGVDQIKELIDGLKNSRMSRRHLLSAWNPTTLNDMALNACHVLVQFNCRPLSYTERLSLNSKENIEKYGKNAFDFTPKYKLDCQMYQRSADLFLGVPYNIASYALLTHILCKICNMVPGDFIHTFGDVHIYDNHMEQIDEQLSREPKSLPTLEIVEEGNDWAAISNLDFDLIDILDHTDFKVKNYDPHPAIKGKLSTGLK